MALVERSSWQGRRNNIDLFTRMVIRNGTGRAELTVWPSTDVGQKIPEQSTDLDQEVPE